MKKVEFDVFTEILYIENRLDYIQNNCIKNIWWSEDELNLIKYQLLLEIIDYSNEHPYISPELCVKKCNKYL